MADKSFKHDLDFFNQLGRSEQNPQKILIPLIAQKKFPTACSRKSIIRKDLMRLHLPCSDGKKLYIIVATEINPHGRSYRSDH